MTTRKHYDSRIKAQVALEALKNQQTIAKIASEYGVHPNLVTQWKQRLLAEIPDIFSSKKANKIMKHSKLNYTDRSVN